MSARPVEDDPSLISFSTTSLKSERKHNKLKSKIEKLSSDNQKLNDEITIKNSEITSLNERNARLNETVKSLRNDRNTIPMAKIEELKKKNARLAAELNCVKSKCQSLEEKYRDLEKVCKEQNEKLEQIKQVEPPPPISPSEIQSLNEKLDKANKKLFETMNQNANLTKELKMANKCLQQEIGESVNFNQILSGNSGWKGRAQQITVLNSKITELREKFSSLSSASFDSVDQQSLKRLESMRRLEVQKFSRELEQYKHELEEAKQKLVSSKTRNKNLVEEASSFKIKCLGLLDKSSHDEELIKCLNEQISMTKYENNIKLDDLQSKVNEILRLKDEAELEIKKLRCELDNKTEDLADKKNEIFNLKLAIEELEKNLRDISGDFLFSCREMSKHDYAKLLQTLEQEKSSLLSFTQQLNERLDQQSEKLSELHETISKQRVKISRLESRLKEVEAEKEDTKAKNFRGLRISEYSRGNQSVPSVADVNVKEKLLGEIEKQKFKLEVAVERIEFLEKKNKEQSEDHRNDTRHLTEIIGRSREMFKTIFTAKDRDDRIISSEVFDETFVISDLTQS